MTEEIEVTRTSEGPIMVEFNSTEIEMSCPHVKGNILPRRLNVYTEGTWNHNSICLDCLIEWANAHPAKDVE